MSPKRRPYRKIQNFLNPLKEELKSVRRCDYHSLERELFRLNSMTEGLKEGMPAFQALKNRIRKSCEEKQRRQLKKPRYNWNPDLPITCRKEEIIKAVKEHQVLVLSGETGSGKTTQIPKFCLAAGRGVEGKIGCTQPRRIAALSVAERIAAELEEPLGQMVGYKIRFQDKNSPRGSIKIMTDGMLLSETRSDPWLNEYDTLIIDEAHERSLNIDFILGYLRRLLIRRRDLKLIITSATIDTEKFSQAFGDAPVIEVSGRTFPVEVRYEEEGSGEISLAERAAAGAESLIRRDPRGDILIFMPTEEDIRECCGLLESRQPRALVLPLYARLSSSEQKKVFLSSSSRKIIVSTNVAETSLTIPGIKYVVDSGQARLARYYPATGTFALPVEPVSRSSADQRKGRCGRVEKGICLRLYSRQDYESRELFTPPEILRTNLAEVILRMISLKLGDPGAFPFIDPPSSQGIADAYRTLEELGAIASFPGASKGRKRPKEKRLTSLGRHMADLPIDPRLSRMIFQAREEACMEEVLIIASSLNVPDPRERPAGQEGRAREAQAPFRHDASDFLTRLNIWRYCEDRGGMKKAGDLRRFCKEFHLSFRRMREWQDIFRQLKNLLEEKGLKVRAYEGNRDNFYAAVHRSILTGFLSHIALRKEKVYYRVKGNRELMLFPGSGLFGGKRAGEWIVCGEIVKTSRLFGRIAANIEPEWLVELGDHLISRSWHSPLWYQDKGAVMAMEQKRLFGFVIAENQVPYGPVNPGEAEDIFIRGALLEGAVKDPAHWPFLEKNRTLIDSIMNMENKLRRRNLLVSEEELFLIYKQRLGDKVYDLGLLEAFLKHHGQEALVITEEDLLKGEAEKSVLEQFPDTLNLGNVDVAVEYNFEPGQEDDGVTLKLPASQARTLSAASLDWAIPGLHKERISALIKGLPKKIRKNLTPINATVDEILKGMKYRNNQPLTQSLSEFIYTSWGLNIPPDVWDEQALPEHLKIRIALKDEGGKVIESARDKKLLYKNFDTLVDPQVLKAARRNWEQHNLTSWTFGEIPKQINPQGPGGVLYTLYPALTDSRKGAASLILVEKQEEAADIHREGVALLLALGFKKELSSFVQELNRAFPFKEGASYFGGLRGVEMQIRERAFLDIVLGLTQVPRDGRAFEGLKREIAPRLFGLLAELYQKAGSVMETFKNTRLFLSRMEGRQGVQKPYIQARREELEALIPPDFIRRYPLERYSDLMRYMKQIRIRTEKGILDPRKDQDREEQYQRWHRRYEKIKAELPAWIPPKMRKALKAMDWYFQEYRIFLFAQEMKTREKVSDQRMEKKLENLKVLL